MDFYGALLSTQLLLTAGEEDLRTVVTNIIRVGFREHNPLVIEWIVRLCGQHLRDVVHSLHVNNDELNGFVVQSDSTAASSAVGSSTAAAAASSSAAGAKEEPMEDESCSVEEEEDWSEAKESLDDEKPEEKPPVKGAGIRAGGETESLYRSDSDHGIISCIH